ncbi:hypothetical protein L484_020109 [Morus notabilis]|uniref:Uncharacterized protein n=1 Tax=Morus notabilis TaxID=981085 RepID=W9RB83_9ROSA|nr:hypothetical protein L484_020109 [Morus notabilis]
MCYEVKCEACGKTTWGGCGRHVRSVHKRIPQDQRCLCRDWPGVNPSSHASQSSTYFSIHLCLYRMFLYRWFGSGVLKNTKGVGYTPYPHFDITNREVKEMNHTGEREQASSKHFFQV